MVLFCLMDRIETGTVTKYVHYTMKSSYKHQCAGHVVRMEK